MEIAAKSSSTNVVAQLSKQYEDGAKNHRRMLLKLLATIKYLARQGLAFRGHHENSASAEGDLYQLLLLQAQDDPVSDAYGYRSENIPIPVNCFNGPKCLAAALDRDQKQ